MEITRLPDGRWDVQVTVADVTCSVCWAQGGEPCVDKQGRPLTELAHAPRRGLEDYQAAGPHYYHEARWKRAAQRGVTPGDKTIRPVKEAVRSSTPRHPVYGRSWNPWPEDYEEAANE